MSTQTQLVTEVMQRTPSLTPQQISAKTGVPVKSVYMIRWALKNKKAKAKAKAKAQSKPTMQPTPILRHTDVSSAELKILKKEVEELRNENKRLSALSTSWQRQYEDTMRGVPELQRRLHDAETIGAYLEARLVSILKSN